MLPAYCVRCNWIWLEIGVRLIGLVIIDYCLVLELNKTNIVTWLGLRRSSYSETFYHTETDVLQKRKKFMEIMLRTKQEAQLPQRNSASAAHMDGGGVGPPAHSLSAPSGYTCAYGRIRKPQPTHVKRAVRKTHFKMNRAFKVIQVILIGADRNPEWSFVVMCI